MEAMLRLKFFLNLVFEHRYSKVRSIYSSQNNAELKAGHVNTLQTSR